MKVKMIDMKLIDGVINLILRKLFLDAQKFSIICGETNTDAG
jgi:hypothetical protein